VLPTKEGRPSQLDTSPDVLELDVARAGPSTLADVLATVLAAEMGEPYGITIVVLRQSRQPVGRGGSGEPAWSTLTAREAAIAALVGQGLTNRQIGSRLYISPHTVNYHLRQIFRKLSIDSRVLLANRAQVELAGPDDEPVRL